MSEIKISDVSLLEAKLYAIESMITRLSQHDHSVLADAINALVERVTALENMGDHPVNAAIAEVVKKYNSDWSSIFSQPIQSKTDNSTAEIRIKPDDMVMVKWFQEDEPRKMRLASTNTGNDFIEYISPIQPIPATVDGGWIPCKSITLRWPEGDIITYKKACAFNYIPGESKPTPPEEVK